MTRAARLDLRSFQQELATRLAAKTAAQVESSRLGLASGSERWLIRLADAGEVIAVPPIVPVPLTQAWFLGLANIRGNLFSVIDFPAFLGHPAVVLDNLARLILVNARNGEQNAGIVVQRVLGLRNLSQLQPAHDDTERPAWHVRRWLDTDGTTWQEIDLGKLSRDPAFLQVGA
ncbi:MAG: chemotaxis protein CheW [Betaproteobacteria bacterium]|jgi:twitching motility protein PilI|nr:chemotaxis protein CheW [Casimicrobiaceae bacterium]